MYETTEIIYYSSKICFNIIHNIYNYCTTKPDKLIQLQEKIEALESKIQLLQIQHTDSCTDSSEHISLPESL